MKKPRRNATGSLKAFGHSAWVGSVVVSIMLSAAGALWLPWQGTAGFNHWAHVAVCLSASLPVMTKQRVDADESAFTDPGADRSAPQIILRECLSSGSKEIP